VERRASRSLTRCKRLWPVLLVLAGCSRDEVPERTSFYERKIAPPLRESCVSSPTRSSCHVSDGMGNAFGNLSLESFDTIDKRRDLFVSYGPYGIPGLLLKVVPPYTIALTSWRNASPQLITTNIAHAGDQLVDFTSPTFTTIDGWIRNGATENNAAPALADKVTQPCSSEIGSDPLFDPSADPPSADFAYFSANVNPLFGEKCAGSNCHGAPANSLYLTCGDTPELTRWNYFAASDYVAADPGASELLRRTLSPAAGGTFHEGGVIFDTSSDPQYRAITEWATQKGPPTNVPTDAGFDFFADRVQPMLVKRGCMQLGCHSAAIFHDYRLRGGSGGHFGLSATRKNYRLSLEQLALESPDPNASRLIRKNLAPYPDGRGALHRGGALFGSGGDPAACDLEAAATGPLDDQTPYCVVVAWFERERAERLPEGEPLRGITFVRRPPVSGLDRPQDWETFAPGAQVLFAAASYDASGELVLGAETDLSALCGLDPATTDARRPAVSWDGTRIAFAARASADAPFQIYVTEGDACAIEPQIAAPAVDEDGNAVPDNGELVHNFDPAFAPDGRIVFVSTRGNLRNASRFAYAGPQRTPADPSKLNTNLYVREADGSIRQLTFLLNQELSPAFMRDGRAIFVAEKRAPGFYQLAGRRINLDGGDYHPLFGQRSSIGFNQFTDVVELADKNLAAIMSDRGAAHGAGALAIVNRSIGIDQRSEAPEDYLVSADVLGLINPEFFQRSIRFVDPAATGKLSGTQGAYRNPSPLPDGKLLVSYAANVVALDAFSGNFDVVVVDPISGASLPLVSGEGDELWPVAVYRRSPSDVFRSRLDEANGSTRVYDDERKAYSRVSILDVGLLTSLLFQNTRTGRPLAARTAPVSVWESLPPEPGVTSYSSPFVTSDQYGELYVRRQLLGSIPLQDDDSASFLLPGGAPVVLQTTVQLAGDTGPTGHFQREEMQFYPGEEVRQSFRREFFNGMCAGCHGSVSGQELDIAVNPDILTQASSVAALGAEPADLSVPAGDPEGPFGP
jgi:hypothetical protein